MKIALVENFGADFYRARLRYASFLREKGHEVIAVIPNDGYVDKVEEFGISVVSINLDIRNRGIRNIILYLSELYKIFKKEKFDVVHLYRLQPNLLGTVASYFAKRNSRIINHITGLGMAFTKNDFKYKFIQFAVKLSYKVNANLFGAKLIFQNEQDKEELGGSGKFIVIKGSAVNEDKFHELIKPDFKLKEEIFGNQKGDSQNEVNLIFVSRLLKQKGLSYLIDAVNQYNTKKEESFVNLLVAGWIDPNNPDSLNEVEIDDFSKNDRIFFLGRRSNINELIAISDIAVLPTFYREGTPRFLLESMAMAKPIITTKMPGCDHLVRGSENGMLINPKSSEEIISALDNILNQDLQKLGLKSKEIYNKEFSEKTVYNQLFKTYL